MKSGTRRPSRSERRPTDDPHRRAADLHRGEHERGVRCREAARVVEEQHDERHDRELSREHERARRAEEPHPQVAQRADELARDLLVDVTLAQHDAREHRPDDRVHGERDERRVNAAGRDERRQRDRAREAAERDRRLADPEREPTLVGANQCMTARPLAEFTAAPNAPVATSATTSAAKPLTSRPRSRARSPRR